MHDSGAAVVEPDHARLPASGGGSSTTGGDPQPLPMLLDPSLARTELLKLRVTRMGSSATVGLARARFARSPGSTYGDRII
jgi:hypothetical protein